LKAFARHRFSWRVKAINFLSQFSKFFRAAKEVEEEGREDSLCCVGTRNNDKVTIVDDDFERYFFFFRTEFVRLWKSSASDRG
jgi:hypothetical protein